jgi:hypothetical protein
MLSPSNKAARVRHQPELRSWFRCEVRTQDLRTGVPGERGARCRKRFRLRATSRRPSRKRCRARVPSRRAVRRRQPRGTRRGQRVRGRRRPRQSPSRPARGNHDSLPRFELFGRHLLSELPWSDSWRIVGAAYWRLRDSERQQADTLNTRRPPTPSEEVAPESGLLWVDGRGS